MAAQLSQNMLPMIGRPGFQWWHLSDPGQLVVDWQTGSGGLVLVSALVAATDHCAGDQLAASSLEWAGALGDALACILSWRNPRQDKLCNPSSSLEANPSLATLARQDILYFHKCGPTG